MPIELSTHNHFEHNSYVIRIPLKINPISSRENNCQVFPEGRLQFQKLLMFNGVFLQSLPPPPC